MAAEEFSSEEVELLYTCLTFDIDREKVAEHLGVTRWATDELVDHLIAKCKARIDAKNANNDTNATPGMETSKAKGLSKKRGRKDEEEDSPLRKKSKKTAPPIKDDEVAEVKGFDNEEDASSVEAALVRAKLETSGK